MAVRRPRREATASDCSRGDAVLARPLWRQGRRSVSKLWRGRTALPGHRFGIGTEDYRTRSRTDGSSMAAHRRRSAPIGYMGDRLSRCLRPVVPDMGRRARTSTSLALSPAGRSQRSRGVRVRVHSRAPPPSQCAQVADMTTSCCRSWDAWFSEVGDGAPEAGDVLVEVGPRLRRIRTQRDITRTELAAATGSRRARLSRLGSVSGSGAWNCCLRSPRRTACPSMSSSARPDVGDPRIRVRT